MVKRIPFLLHSPEKAAETFVCLASSPEVAGVSGRFYSRNRKSNTMRITHDTGVAARLWDVSESLSIRLA